MLQWPELKLNHNNKSNRIQLDYYSISQIGILNSSGSVPKPEAKLISSPILVLLRT